MRRPEPPLQLAMAEVYESRVWVEHPELGFAPGRIVRDVAHEAQVVVEALDGTQFRMPRGTCAPIHPNSLLGVPDLLELGEFSLAALLHNVRVRYEKGEYYSSIGLPILISVNPYKPLPHLYDAVTRRRYQSAQFLLLSPPSTHRTPKSNSSAAAPSPRSPLLFADNPHLFGTAQMTYSSLMRNNQAQSIVVSGESGAGKTEATKILLRYFSELDDGTTTTNTPKATTVSPFALVSGGGAKLRSSNPTGGGSTGRSPLALSKSPTTSQAAAAVSAHEHISIELHALRSNPILEAFGNAKTLRNDNSSRFGKFIQIFFDLKNRRRIRKAKISHYLLEKCRLVSLHPQERNYHVFYALLYGGRQTYADKLQQWELMDDTIFARMLGDEPLDVSEVEVFDELVSCMLSVGFDQEEIDQVFELIAGLLHLSTLDFEDVHSSAATYNADVPLTRPVDMRVVERCARLFGLTKAPPYGLRGPKSAPRSPLESFLDIFLWGRVRDATGSGSIIPTKRDANGARYLRDAIIKEAYSRLFEWLVRKINLTLCSKEEAERRAAPPPAVRKNTRIMESLRETPGLRGGGLLAAAAAAAPREATSSPPIGLLDIYGFEVFEGRNSFEQLCINYANEKLQQHFNHHVLSLEQKTYKEEGIEWNDIAFADNKHIIDALENKLDGVFSLLDSATLAPQADESWFLRELETTRHRDVVGLPSLKSGRRRCMVVRHYAGDVEYTVDAFVEKNKDKLSHDVAYYFGLCSTSRLLQTLFPPVNTHFSTRTNSLKATVSLEFRTQLSGLLTSLTSTTPTYVRCIKPNGLKQPHLFDSLDVLRQLKYAGLLESIRIRNSGFGVRCTFDEFLDKYALVDPLARTTWRKARPDLTLLDKARLCTRILDSILPQSTPPESSNHSTNGHTITEAYGGSIRPLRSSSPQARAWQTGQTRVFMKEEVQIHLEKCRTQVMSDNAIRIQARWRSRYTRLIYLRSREAIIRLQRSWRKRRAFNRIMTVLRYNLALIKVKRWLRWMVLRKRRLRARRAAKRIQRFWRRCLMERQMRDMLSAEGDESGLADEDMVSMGREEERRTDTNGNIHKASANPAGGRVSTNGPAGSAQNRRSPRFPAEDGSLSPRDRQNRSRGISLEESSLASVAARHRHRSCERRKRRNTMAEGRLRRLDTATHTKPRRERNPELDLFNRERENQRTISALRAQNEALGQALKEAQRDLERKKKDVEKLTTDAKREADLADCLTRMHNEATHSNGVLQNRLRKARRQLDDLARVLNDLYSISCQDRWRAAAACCIDVANFMKVVRAHAARIRDHLYEIDNIFEEAVYPGFPTTASRELGLSGLHTCSGGGGGGMYPAMTPEDCYSDGLYCDGYGRPCDPGMGCDYDTSYLPDYHEPPPPPMMQPPPPQAMYAPPQVGWNSTTIRAGSPLYPMDMVQEYPPYQRPQRVHHRHSLSQSRGGYDPVVNPSDTEYLGHVTSQCGRMQPDIQSSGASSARLCQHGSELPTHRGYASTSTRFGQYPAEHQGVVLSDAGRYGIGSRGSAYHQASTLPRSSSRGSREDLTPSQHDRVLSCNLPASMDPSRAYHPQASSDEASNPHHPSAAAAAARMYQTGSAMTMSKPPKSARQTPSHRVSNSMRLPQQRYDDSVQPTSRLPPSSRTSRKSLQTSPGRKSSPQGPIVVQPLKANSPFNFLDGKLLAGENSATSSTISHTKRCIQRGLHGNVILSNLPSPIDAPPDVEFLVAAKTSSDPVSSDSSNSDVA